MNPLRQRRNELGVTIDVIAERGDKYPQDVGSWERGKTVPTMRSVERIAAAYEISLEKAILIRYAMALGRELTGTVEPGITHCSLADWVESTGQTGDKIAAGCGCIRRETVWAWKYGHLAISAQRLPKLSLVLGKSEASVAVASYLAWEKENEHES